MFVFHDATGAVLYTIRATELPPYLAGQTHIEVPDATDLRDLSALSVIDGELVVTDLTGMKAQAVAEINRLVGEVRLNFVTQIPGQEMLYVCKEMEARQYVQDAAPDLADYPLLSTEIGVTAPDAWSLAQLWLNMGALWRSIAGPMETARMVAYASIEAATSPAEIEAAVAAFQIPTLE